MPRLVFMGTPDFAVPSLEKLAGRYEIAAVVTQPDRPAGRSRRLTPPPVKEVALALGLPLWQPPTLRAPEAVARLRALAPHLIVVVAFGQILRPDVLGIPPHGCLNVHGSLLPRHRGPAPVAAAILAGETGSGVTLMRLDAGMDTGPILAQAACPILPDDTTASLGARLSCLGADLLIETLPRWLAGEITPRPQDEAQATYCRLMSKADGRLNWDNPAAYLARQVRACLPWPAAFTNWQGQPLKVLRAATLPDWQGQGEPGQVITLDDGTGVVTGEGVLRLEEVQLAGKRAMPIEEFLRGQPGFLGALLGQ
ncbi:MAG: methionyl-tRNA formyltransferase [Chloroflexota bacterium]